MDPLSLFESLTGWSTLQPSDKADVFRSLVLAFVALSGLVFLVWRAISTDRLARAATRQAEVAAGNLSVSMEQLKHQARQLKDGSYQLEILAKNSELTAAALTESTKNNLLEHFYLGLDSLAKAEQPLNRVVAVTVVADIARHEAKLSYGALTALEHAARQWSPATPLEAKEITIGPGEERTSSEDKLAFVKHLPVAFWQFMARPAELFSILTLAGV